MVLEERIRKALKIEQQELSEREIKRFRKQYGYACKKQQKKLNKQVRK